MAVDIRNLIQEGLGYFDKRDWEKAAHCFAKAKAANEQHPIPYFFLGLTYFAINQFDESKSYLNRGLELAPENALGWNIKALHAFGEKKTDEALTILKVHGLSEHPRIQAFFLREIEKLLLEFAA